MLAIISAAVLGVVLGFLGCAVLTAGALADARSATAFYAARLRQFANAYHHDDRLALIAAYNAAERALHSPGDKHAP